MKTARSEHVHRERTRGPGGGPSLRAATDPDRRDARMLVVRAGGPTEAAISDSWIDALPRWLDRGDLLVLNDAATLPAALRSVRPRGEVRLVARAGPDRFVAVLFGPGDHTIDTELRPAPAEVAVGDAIRLEGGLGARVVAVDPDSPRLVELRFDRAGSELVRAIYRVGRPVQYAYLRAPLPLSAVQNVFAGPAWAMEMPSAARPLDWRRLGALRASGVELASVTHAAGLSATGDPRLDARLPLPERYRVPAATVTAIEAARARGRRVIAVGSTVVRALEGCAAAHGRLVATRGVTDLVLGPSHRPAVVDAVLSNVHAPGESHFELLCAFVPAARLRRAARHAASRGYLAHELGDAMLLLP